MAQHFNLFKAGRVDEKRALHADTVGNAAYREVAIDSTASQTHHNALERLKTFAAPLNDSHLQANRVA